MTSYIIDNNIKFPSNNKHLESELNISSHIINEDINYILDNNDIQNNIDLINLDIPIEFNEVNLNVLIQSNEVNLDVPIQYNKVNLDVPIQSNEVNLDVPIQSNIDLDKQINICNNKDEKLCNTCLMPYKILDECLICEKCGIEKVIESEIDTENYNMCLESNYNSNSDSYVSFSFKGKGSYGYQKALLIACSDYTAITHKEVLKELMNIIDQYEGNKLPKNIINLAIDLYFTIKSKANEYFSAIYGENNIKKKLILRGKGKLGMYADCLYYACIMENLSRTPREIANIVNIEEKYMSAADKKIQEFYELGLIDLPINIRLIDDYINRYFPLLGIPMKYKDFIIYLINRAEQKYIHINNESRISTKCIGAIYLLCQRIPELKHITREIIAQNCKISKSTCNKYYQLLISNWKYIKKAFKKYRIPQPIEWKKTMRKR
jgi:hypothetical protein